MAGIYQPKKSGGLMGSKAFGVGLGIATGNPMMAAGALAGEDSPAGKMLSIYNRFNSFKPDTIKPNTFELGESVVDETPMAPSPMDSIKRRFQNFNPIPNQGMRRYA